MDGLMMDRLYQELEPARQTAFDAHVAGCARCAAELATFQRTRAAFRELASADPPASVSAILLHEAARRAPAERKVMGGGGLGWFGALLRPLVAHPGAAALASLVLVAGVAGTLWVRKGDDSMARPRATGTAATAPSAPAAASPDQPALPTNAPESPSAGVSGERWKAAAQGVVADRAAEPDDVAADASRQDRAQADDGYAADLLDRERAGKLANLREPIADRRLKAADKPRPARTANVVSGADPLIALEGTDGDEQGGLVSPPPSAAAVDTVAPKTRGPSRGTAAGGGEAKRDATKKKLEFAQPADAGDATRRESYRAYKDPAWLERQSSSLSAAVKDRRCRDAAAIANDILDRDPEFYTTKVADSKAMASCGWYVRDEKSRRAKARASKAATTIDAAAESEAAPAQAAPAGESK